MIEGPIEINEIYQMKKVHPCGNKLWRVVRTGADIKIRCLGCNRLIMMERSEFAKRAVKRIDTPSD